MDDTTIYTALFTSVPVAFIFFGLGIWIGARTKRDQNEPASDLSHFPASVTLPIDVATGSATQTKEVSSNECGCPAERKIIYIDSRDMDPIDQLEAVGYECHDIDDNDEFARSVAGRFNFADEGVGFTCNVCRTDYYPVRAWGTSKTARQGLIGFFCRACGCGFTVTYSTKNGSVTDEPATIDGFLRPAPAKIIELADISKSVSASAERDNNLP